MRSFCAERLGVLGSRVLLLLAIAVLVLPLLGLALALLSSYSSSASGASAEFILNRRQLGLLIQSVLFSAAVTAATCLAGTALAMALHRTPAGRSRLTFLLPPLLAVPPAIHGINWSVTLMTVTDWFSRHGLGARWLDGWVAAFLTEVLAYLPVALAIGWAASAMLDAGLVEAGSVYGSEAKVLVKISLRLVLPVLLCGACVVFLLSLSDYAVPSIFSVSVFALEIFSTYSTGIHPSAAVWTAAPLMLIVALILAAGLPLVRRAQALTSSPRTLPGSFDHHASTPWAPALVLLVYFLLPVCVIAASAGVLARAAANARSEIAVTLLLASFTTVLCLLLGQAAARVLDGGGAASAWILALIAITFALPAPLTGIGILQIGGQAGGFDGGLALWANTARFLPIAVLVSFALRRRAPQGLIEAGQVFARSRLQAFGRVTLPLMLPGVIAMAALCFSFSIGELGATLLVAAPGNATLMMRLYNLLHYGASREASALCLLLTLPALLAGALLTAALRYQARRIAGEPRHV